MENKQRKINNKVVYVMLILWGMLFIVFLRFGWLQLIKGDELGMLAKERSQNYVTRQSPRGRILDRNGRELAISRMAKCLVVDPSKVDDAEVLAAELSPIVGVKPDRIISRIADGGMYYCVKHGLEPDEEAAINQLISEKNYECVRLDDEVKRYYPNDMLAASVLGFIGSEDQGLAGLEYSMEKLIKGDVLETNVTTDPQGRGILDTVFATSQRKYSGDNCKDITLTIDATMQFIVEQNLDKAMAEHAPKAVTCIVMDPQTGEILAMANRPSFNPNKFWNYSDEDRMNRAIGFNYEPGSTFKSVVAGAALQEGVVSPNQTFYDPGRVVVSDRTIQNWNGESFGMVTFTDIVKNSINTCFALIGQSLTGAKLNEYAKNFGFGEETGIELPGEEAGLLKPTEKLVDSDVATMSIGHTLSVTPLQLIRAMAAIANDGVLLKPHIIKQINNADGSVYQETQREEVRRVLESSVDKMLVGMLEQVVSTGGGQKAGVKGYRIAGKTGTAQKINPNTSGYMEGHYIASFCGFAPVEKPELVVLVIIDDPTAGGFYGGQIAAPVASDIFAQLLRYKHIEPSSDPFFEMNKDKDTKRTPSRTAKEMKAAPPGKVRVPDFTGMSIRDVSSKLGELGLGMNMEGSGFATSQDVPAGSVVDPGSSITVYFKP